MATKLAGSSQSRTTALKRLLNQSNGNAAAAVAANSNITTINDLFVDNNKSKRKKLNVTKTVLKEEEEEDVSPMESPVNEDEEEAAEEEEEEDEGDEVEDENDVDAVTTQNDNNNNTSLNETTSLAESIKRIENNQNLLMLKMDLIIETFKYFQSNYITKTKFKNCMKSVNGKQYSYLKQTLNNDDDEEDDEDANNDSEYEGAAAAANNEENDPYYDNYQPPAPAPYVDADQPTMPQKARNSKPQIAPAMTNRNGNSHLKKIFTDNDYDENNEDLNESAAASAYYKTTPVIAGTYNASKHLNNPIPYDILNLDEAIAANYHTLDTQEIAVKLKEILTNHEISREVFGEAILNASRKVTNYILTAPKTFQQQSKLYQERYLKVQMWLNDPLRIEKIKQWKSENNLKQLRSDRSQVRNPITPTTPMLLSAANHSNNNNSSSSNFKLTPIASSNNHHHTNNNTNNNLSLNDDDHMNQFVDNYYNSEASFNDNDIDNEDVASNQQHSPYEDVQIDTNSITTEEIANQLKDVLLKYKISQRLFGQAVLNAHKNVVSLLLIDPKTWSTLSRQARERYVQIFAWLNDKNRFKKINDFLETQNYNNKQHSGFR